MTIASYIDHTLLKPTATIKQIEQLCSEAEQYQFAAVCVNPCHVHQCFKALRDTEVKICSVIGFPLGANTSEIKIEEARVAINSGANELDMVINIGDLLSGNLIAVKKEIVWIAHMTHVLGNGLLKVIIETGFLTDEQKVIACELAVAAGADFVKTCTGFNGGQATVEDIRLMKARVGDSTRVKASGGIKDYATALAMINAGASRIGTSSGVKIVLEEQAALAQ